MLDREAKAFSVKISEVAKNNLKAAAKKFDVTQNLLLTTLLESNKFDHLVGPIAKLKKELIEAEERKKQAEIAGKLTPSIIAGAMKSMTPEERQLIMTQLKEV